MVGAVVEALHHLDRSSVSDNLLRQGEIRSPHEPEPQFIRSPQINKGDANEGNGLHRYCATWMPVRSLTLGAEGVLPGRQIESLLKVCDQFAPNLPSG